MTSEKLSTDSNPVLPETEDAFQSHHLAEKTTDEPLIRVMALHALAYCERLFYLEEVEEIRVREATVDDIERIDELTLDDFAGNLAQIDVSHDGNLSNEQMGGLVSTFLETLNSP